MQSQQTTFLPPSIVASKLWNPSIKFPPRTNLYAIKRERERENVFVCVCLAYRNRNQGSMILLERESTNCLANLMLDFNDHLNKSRFCFTEPWHFQCLQSTFWHTYTFKELSHKICQLENLKTFNFLKFINKTNYNSS